MIGMANKFDDGNTVSNIFTTIQQFYVLLNILQEFKKLSEKHLK